MGELLRVARTPAHTGVYLAIASGAERWVPAFAGMRR
jgi:hypothetical protein